MISEHVRSREELVQLVAKGTAVHYFFFWGHRPLASGEIAQLKSTNHLPVIRTKKLASHSNMRGKDFEGI